MNLMEEIRSNSGMESELNEGIKYNKTSKKLNKVLARMEISVRKSPQIAQDSDYKLLKSKLTSLRDDFIKVEGKYKDSKGSEKGEAKAEHKEMYIEFKKVIKLVEKVARKDPSFKKVVGSFLIILIGAFLALSGSLAIAGTAYAGGAIVGGGALSVGVGTAAAGQVGIIAQIIKALKSKSLKNREAKRLLDLYNEIESEKKVK